MFLHTKKIRSSLPLVEIDKSIQERLSYLEQNPTPENWIITEEEKQEWPRRLEKWRDNWKTVKSQVENNAPQLLFSKNPSTRESQYLGCLQQLHQAFLGLAQENRDYFLFETSLPDLVNICYTGWQERLFQLQEQALPITSSCHKEEDIYGLADKGAYLLRRSLWLEQILPLLVSPELASNVHYQRMTKQWANLLYDLRYKPEELGAKEENLLSLYQSLLEKEGAALFQEKYNEANLVKQLQCLYPEKKNFLDPLIQQRIDKMEKGFRPYLDPQISLQQLYSELKNLETLSSYELFVQELKKLHNRFIEEEHKPPFSALTPVELAQSYLKTSPIQLAFLQGKDLRAALEKKEYLSITEKEKILFWIEQLEEGESKDKQIAFVENKKKEIQDLRKRLSQKILTHNRLLLERAIEDEAGTLLPFGANLWAEAAGLLPIKPYPIPKPVLRSKLLTTNPLQSLSCLAQRASYIHHITSLFLYHTYPSNSLLRGCITKEKQKWVKRLVQYYKRKNLHRQKTTQFFHTIS